MGGTNKESLRGWRGNERKRKVMVKKNWDLKADWEMY